MFICGRRSFKDKHGSPHSIPKKSKISRRLIGKDTTKRNPYAEDGLDRFRTLLADLDEEKQKIYSQIGAEEVSFVRFVYSDSFKNARPIVVRAKNNGSGSSSSLKLAPNSSTTTSRDEEIGDGREKEKGEKKEETMKMCERWNIGSLCFGVMMVLVFVAIHGRSFAIVCTTIVWYLVPVIIGGSPSSSSRWRKAK